MVLEKTLENPLDCKEIQPVHSEGDQPWDFFGRNDKGNQPWIFIGRTDAEAEAESPNLWPPDVKGQLVGKDPDAGKDGRHKEKGVVEDEMAR